MAEREDAVADHVWKPAPPLREIASPDLVAAQTAYARWREIDTTLRGCDPDRLKALKQRLIRRLIVEMGLLESLYELDRASTEALVVNGFAAANVKPTSTNMEPERLVTLLRNQEIAILPLLEATALPALTLPDIQRIHAIQMQHQDTAAATDAFGQKILVPLLRGVLKAAPNDLRLPDGSLHQFCPPERVEPELHRMLDIVSSARDADPVVVAAWLHSNLYHLHPFQTGNGRVVRAATTHFMLRAGLLPIVVEREDRAAYKAAMTGAAEGDIMPLTTLFLRAEAATIGRALVEAGDRTSIHDDNHKLAKGRVQ
jgi:hypothetical protein